MPYYALLGAMLRIAQEGPDVKTAIGHDAGIKTTMISGKPAVTERRGNAVLNGLFHNSFVVHPCLG